MKSKNQDPDLVKGKSDVAVGLYRHFIAEYTKLGPISIYPAKSMIAIVHAGKKIAWITQFGKNYLHVVFPFKTPHNNNMCFQKIASVPGPESQYNHHFRMLLPHDINDEVRKFMKMAREEN